MGKKRKNRKRLYNKKEFINIFCNNCGVCKGDPVFCYEEIYKENPELFISKVRKHLKEVCDWKKDKGTNNISLSLLPAEFRYAFCNALAETNACGIDTLNCEYFQKCYTIFENQAFGKRNEYSNRYNRKQKKTKQRAINRYVCKPYPTIIVSDDDDWKKFIKEILSDGNSDREQNTTETAAI
jgi:hypothetical protein